MSSPRIALLTHHDLSDLTPDDRLLEAALVESARVDVVPWDAPDALHRLADVEMAVIRSTWNYTDVLSAFLAFLEELHQTDTVLLNPASVVRWNCDKHYLGELERLGIAGLPTVYLARGSHVDLADLMRDRNWDDVVIKPTVSATARGLFRVNGGRLSADAGTVNDALTEALNRTDLMVQPLAPEIVDQGEWSLMFFDGHYSHAVRKRAVAGDIRVQSNFGGTVHSQTPPQALVTDAEQILETVHEQFAEEAPLPYARVDGIERNGRLVLMELELIEPELFFRCDAGAAQRCAEAVLERL